MHGEAPATPVPEKLRGYPLIDILHCSPLLLKPTAETVNYPDLLLRGPSRIALLREMLNESVDVETDGAKVQPL
jgi:hypothetical protein